MTQIFKTLILWCLIIPIISVGLSALTFTKIITLNELQERIEVSFPLSQKNFLFNTTLSNPKIVLNKGVNRMGIDVDLALFSGEKPISQGSVFISGQIDYRPLGGEFYLKDTHIDNLNLQGISKERVKQVELMLEIIARGLLSKIPIYRLKEENLKHRLAKSMLKSVKINNGKMEIALELF